MAASMGAALAGVDFTCHPYTPGGRSGFLQLAERMQLLPRSRPSSTSLLSGFVRLRYALDWGLPPFLPGSSGHAMSAYSCTSSGRPLRPPRTGSAVHLHMYS